jgi:hypothetical protein
MSELCREAALGRGCSPLWLEEGKEGSGVSFGACHGAVGGRGHQRDDSLVLKGGGGWSSSRHRLEPGGGVSRWK